jgi:hypothetical protein
MKIILEHDEVLQLQEVNRTPHKTRLLNNHSRNILSGLLQAGLVGYNWESNIAVMRITQLGKKVLNEHLPITFPTVHYQTRR